MATTGPIEVRIDPDIRDLVPGYLAHRRAELQRARDALASADFATLQRIGHNLRGAAASYGFTALAPVGGRMEDAARAADAGTLGACLEEIADYLARVRVVYRD